MSSYSTKPHFELLDGLRGVAALMVICYHVFEGFATSPVDQHFNHGYLAVDFFFILSGFVIGYAYDDRWGTMSVKDFFKRRLVRLHPMVVLGVLLGAMTFLTQGSVQWDGTHVPFLMVLVAMLLNLLMLPAIPGTGPEVRGNGEMFPLNGPNWSLFFEYIGNILYAFCLRKMSTKALTVFVAVCGALLSAFAVGNMSGFGHLGVGWSLSEWNFPGGMLRMLFSYSMGMLIARTFKPVGMKHSFLICSLLLIVFLSMPHVGGEDSLWMNGIYDSFCILVLFPALLYIGACGLCEGAASKKVCKFFGDISYPVYVVHYPFMYLFFAWVWNNGLSFAQAWPVAVLTVAGCLLLAWICMKFYDAPVRKYLSGKYL